MFDDLSEEPSLDITPLIDVIFMLLIFFIMTTTFSKPVLDIILPSSEMASPSDTHKEELVISIKQNGKLYYQEKEIDKAELNALLLTKPDSLLNLYVDEKTPFEAFVGVVDVAKKRPGGHFVISTQPAKI